MAHDTRIESEVFTINSEIPGEPPERRIGYRVFCSCGWASSPPEESRELAEDYAADHKRAMSRRGE